MSEPLPPKVSRQGLSANLVSSLNSNLLNSFNFGWNRIYANFKCTGLDKLDSVSQLDQFGNGRGLHDGPVHQLRLPQPGLGWPIP